MHVDYLRLYYIDCSGYSSIHSFDAVHSVTSPNIRRVTVAGRSCHRDGFKEHNGQCYYFSDDTKTWSDAKAACAAMGAKLVSITSAEENEYVRNDARRIWVGLSQSSKDAPYEWVDGSSVDFTNWNSGEPNNHMGTAELCVEQLASGPWNDKPCRYTLHFVCKTPAAKPSAGGCRMKFKAGETWTVVAANGRNKKCECPDPVPSDWSKKEHCTRI